MSSDHSEEKEIVVRQPHDARTDPINWDTVDETELEERASVFSYNLKEAKKRVVDSERWVAVIATHLYIDHIFTRLLAENLKNPDALVEDPRRIYLLDKLNICHAMGWIDPQFLPLVRKINSLRNRLAHNLVFDLPDETENELVSLLPKEGREIVAEKYVVTPQAPNPPIGEYLQLLLVLLDINRQAVLRRNYLSRLRNRELGKAMRDARTVLEEIKST